MFDHPFKTTDDFHKALLEGEFKNSTDGPYSLTVAICRPRNAHDRVVGLNFQLRSRKDLSICKTDNYDMSYGDTISVVDIGKLLNLRFGN